MIHATEWLLTDSDDVTSCAVTSVDRTIETAQFSPVSYSPRTGCSPTTR